jgi:hypothetical protein
VETDICPACGQAVLTYLPDEQVGAIHTQPPELVLPFSAPKEQVQTAVSRFVKTSKFAPADLTAGNLNGRLQPIYLPMWLVDATATAQWQAEVGFDYQIVSHREQFHNGSWQSQKIKETKIRWEPRVGRLQRHYDNKAAPALEEQSQWERVLGKIKRREAQPYQSAEMQKALAHLPNRPPADAWPEAEAALKRAAAKECQQAAAANHIREFRWTAEYAEQNWTQLLYPVYTTWYQDDDGQAQMVYVNGQTGKLAGQRRASMKKARKWSIGIGVGAALLFALSLLLAAVGFFEASVLPWAGIGFVAAVAVGVTAVLPLLLAWSINSFGLFTDGSQQALTELVEAIRAR